MNKGFGLIWIIVGTLVLGGVASGIYLIQQKTNVTHEPSLSNETIENKSVSPGSVLFESEKLGVRFYHAKVLDGRTVQTLEQGNKVYVYFQGDEFEYGQFLEVFDKDPNLSLKEAIEKQFLTGYSPNDCQVKIDPAPRQTRYEEAAIIYTKGWSLDDPTLTANEICPSKYTPTNYLAFFIMDKNNPSKFGFVQIGQYSIEADADKPLYPDGFAWQDTVEFFK